LAATTTSDDDEDAFAVDGSDEEDIDDQTEALLKGFESDDDEEKDPEDQGYEVSDEIPKVSKKIRKKAQAAEKASASGKPGVVYVGRIPHGFYEQEMRQYFSQFGNITNLRLSRNRKTGKSKHFAFVQFESAEVAEIVSKTMDNYLLFGHILKCKLVAPEQIHKDLWIGANKRFKSVPWNKIQGRKLSQAMTVAGWERRLEKEEKRRAEKKSAMKLMDYDFESPKLKSAKEVSKKSQQQLTTATGNESGEEEPKLIEAPEKMETQAVTAATKKNKEKNDTGDAAKHTNGVAEAAEGLAAVTAEPSKKKKSKKEKFSDMLVGVEKLKKSVSAKDADAGLAEKIEKVKKSKKHRGI
jgi:nucleolar protein 15